MDRGEYAGAFDVLPSETVIIEKRLIDKVDRAVGQRAPDHARDRVDDEPKPVLGSLDFVESAFQRRSRLVLLGNVHHRSDELDTARFIAQGMRHSVHILD